MEERQKQGGVSDAGWEISRRMRKQAEPYSTPPLRIDTTKPLEEGLAEIARVAYPF